MNLFLNLNTLNLNTLLLKQTRRCYKKHFYIGCHCQIEILRATLLFPIQGYKSGLFIGQILPKFAISRVWGVLFFVVSIN